MNLSSSSTETYLCACEGCGDTGRPLFWYRWQTPPARRNDREPVATGSALFAECHDAALAKEVA